MFKNIKKILLLSLVLLSFASQSKAAGLELQSDIQKIGIGNYFQVNIFLNSEDVPVNTIEAEISYPKDLIQLGDIRTGNSIINFWVDQPKNNNGVIEFSGIIPGGYNDKKGLLFSLIFETKTLGKGIVEFKNIQAFKNDGLGTAVTMDSSNLSFETVSSSEEYSPIEMEDYVKPEKFVPQINQTKELFDGKYFLVFSTQDKGMGIDYYEVCEGNIDDCVKADSPYLLKNQNLDKEIFVKAVDKKGNERIASLSPKNNFRQYENYLIFAIIILIIILIAFLIEKLWIKLKK